jgi:hypothetical protein
MPLLKHGISSITFISYGSFKTIPNPLKQLPVKNLIIPEAPYRLVLFYKILQKIILISVRNLCPIQLLRHHYIGCIYN